MSGVITPVRQSRTNLVCAEFRPAPTTYEQEPHGKRAHITNLLAHDDSSMSEDSVSTVSHMIRILHAYTQNGTDEVNEVADQLHEQAHQQPSHAFSKQQVWYLPQSPFPPFMWRYECERCQFWREGGPGEPGGCHIVGQEGDPFGGKHIHPRGWCGLWTPPKGEPAFAWFRERLKPDGKSSVRGEYDPPLTQKERLQHEQQKQNQEQQQNQSKSASSQQASQNSRGDDNED